MKTSTLCYLVTLGIGAYALGNLVINQQLAVPWWVVGVQLAFTALFFYCRKQEGREDAIDFCEDAEAKLRKKGITHPGMSVAGVSRKLIGWMGEDGREIQLLAISDSCARNSKGYAILLVKGDRKKLKFCSFWESFRFASNPMPHINKFDELFASEDYMDTHLEAESKIK